MSDAPHDKDAHPGDAHSHSVYEGKAADTIPPDEPHTPGWMPLVGVALVLAVIMGFALTDPSPNDADGESEPAEQQAAPSPEPEAAGAARPAPARPAASAPRRAPGLATGLVRPRPAPGDPGARRPPRQAPPSPAP